MAIDRLVRAGSRLELFGIGALLVGGLGITAFGLSLQDWPDVLLIKDLGTSAGYLYFILISALAIGLVSKAARLGSGAVAAFLAAAVAVVADGTGALVAVLLYLCASWSVGHIVLHRLCRSGSAVEETTKALVGAGLYATVVGVCVHFKVNYPWVYLAMLALPVIVAAIPLLRITTVVARKMAEDGDGTDRRIERSLLGALILLYFTFAFLPELSHDALAMHLAVPAYVAINQVWNFDPGLYIWTFMPMLADWSYTIGYVLAGESAARLVNSGFVLAVVFLAREFVLWLGGCRRGADWAALILLSAPLTLLVGSSLFVEPFWCAFLLAGTMWIFRALLDEREQPAAMLQGGMVLGFAVAAKAIALTYVPCLVPALLLRVRAWVSKPFLWSVAMGGLVLLALGAWPYALAYALSGNPVFPFFNSTFESPFYPAVDFDNTLFRSPMDWHLPYLLVFSAKQFGGGGVGGSGFHWLTVTAAAFAAAILFRNRRAVVLAAIAVLSLIVVFQFQTFLRYIFPVSALTSVLIGLAVSNCLGRHRGLGMAMVAATGLTVLLNLMFLGSTTSRYRDVPILEIFRGDGADELVAERAPVRQAVELLNSVNRVRAPVALLSEPAAAGLESVALYNNWHNQKFHREIGAVTDPDSFASVLRKHRARYVVFDPRRKGNEGGLADFVAATGDLLGTFGSVEAYRVKSRWFYAEELLQAPSSPAASPWLVSDGAKPSGDGSVIVSKGAPVTQVVAVRPGDFYLNAVTARCADDRGHGRVQVNWRDERGVILSSDLRVFKCNQAFKRESQEVKAPPGAATAAVYGVSHGDAPVVVSRVSFRWAGG